MAFVGKKNSGKTTLLVRLVEELTGRGLRVGTVKHHGHVGFDFDVEGRDSWRHRQAGSVFTVVASPDQVASSRALEAEVPLESLIAEMEASARNAQGECLLDVILVEGYRQGKLPTVELFRAENPRDAERELGGEGNRIVAVVTDMPRIVSAAASQGLPAFGFSDIGDLASFTLASLGVAGHVGEGAESSQQQAGSEPAPQAAATAAPDQRQTDCNPAPQAAAATEPGQQQAGSEPALRGDPKEVQAQCR
jgi:molybdopterin-guanine dinucleotide biosynthesis protein MobB